MKKKIIGHDSNCCLDVGPFRNGYFNYPRSIKGKSNPEKSKRRRKHALTLKKGSRSSYVRDLQQSLKDVKYHVGVDGIFRYPNTKCGKGVSSGS
ncbi:hypothetical protein RCO48_23550 [Peribacillus frigoritolerans]|nr:hypothetical protein [Peribacillus frigoritolerans]